MQELELVTEKMGFEGVAIARENRFVIFVEGALPGETVRAEITTRKRKHAFARVLEVLKPSPLRVTAPCPLFGRCGGCTFQQMAYDGQLRMKRDVLVESLHGVPGVPEKVLEPIGADSTTYFRNKMGFAFGWEPKTGSDPSGGRGSGPFSSGRTGTVRPVGPDPLPPQEKGSDPVLGLHRKGDWRHVIPTPECLLESPESGEILRRTMDFAKARQVPVFDEDTESGVLRHLQIREGKHTGQRMVHLHVAAPHPAIDELPAVYGSLCDTFLVSTHRNVPEQAPPDSTRVVTGAGRIQEKLNGFTFEIGPATFFQTNTLQAEKLFRVVTDFAAGANAAVAVDLYAGTGPIAIHLSRAAGRVVAIEANADSVRMAHRNIELNGLANVEAICAVVEHAPEKVLPAKADLIVVDPPRPGLHKKAMDIVLGAAAKTFIYVSCNPATLARDLKILTTSGYTLESLQPVDMFPHAFHIESVALLRRP